MRDEDRIAHLKICFKLIDIDRDGTLNLLNLLHLYKNVPGSSEFGIELLKLINFHIKRNIEVNTFRERVTINFEVFSTILMGKFSLIKEIRSKFLGIGIDMSSYSEDYLVSKPTVPLEDLKKLVEPVSCFSPQPGHEIETEEMAALIENVEVIDDTSKGQRNFRRNIDRLLNKLTLVERDKLQF